MTNLDALRAKLMANQNKEQKSTNDNAVYPHWNIPTDTTATIRFLEDGDATNDFFWVERNMINLKFPGIIGQDTDKEVTVKVPCMEMWKETCPVLTEIRPWFKDASLEDIARQYWKKRSYVFQGVVRDDPMSETDRPENPIRRFVISPSIFKIIEQTLMDPEMEDIPTDHTSGTDFRITKGQKGQYADYGTSGYSRKTSPLTNEELAAIEEHGLFNLNDFLPKKPDETGIAIIKEMFEASVNGELYDPARWANHYKPYGLKQDANATTQAPAAAPVATTAPAVETVVESAAVVQAIAEAPVRVETVVETAPVAVETVVETVVAAAPVAVVEPIAPAVPADAGAKKSPAEILAQIKRNKEANG